VDARSRFLDLDGPVHYVEHGHGASVDPARSPVVCLHGLSGSHVSWHDLAPLLATGRRVLSLDLAGHGRTPRAGRSASVSANGTLLARFLEQAVGGPAVLLGNSMGAAIAMLHAARHPETVRGLVLIGPALPRVRTSVPPPALARQVALCAVPSLGERALTRRRAKLAPEDLVEQTLRLTTADASSVSLDLRARAAELVASRAAGTDSEAAFLEAARSVGLLVARAASYRAVIASISAPALVLQGAQDRLVPAAGVRQLRTLQPDWQVAVLDGVGHVPHIEQPARTAAMIEPWLSRLDASPLPAAVPVAGVLAPEADRPERSAAPVLASSP
jgi:pimeloyl-ACP methyl ester carboxylesterase